MSHESARQFIDQAKDAIHTGRHRQALDLLDRAIRLDASDSEAFVLRGVAYSALGESQPATEAFRTAIGLAPHNAKAFFNYGVHLYGLGEKADALEMAREAVRVDPMYGQARDMAARIELETGTAPLFLPPPKAPAASDGTHPSEEPGKFAGAPSSVPNYERDPYSGECDAPVHSMAFIERMGKRWDAFGWCLAALNLILFVGFVLVIPTIFSHRLTHSFGFDPFSPSAHQPWYVTWDVVSACLIQLLLLVWTCLDIADRRGNWLWVFPWVVSCCCISSWAIHALYMWTGRSTR